MRVVLFSLFFVFVSSNPIDNYTRAADLCAVTECKIENNCRCSSNINPLGDAETPQLISLTFDEAVVENLYTQYWEPILFDRVNPDGNSIRATFFVPHEYSDYEKVQQLYLHGMEIAVHSVTKNPLQSYWRDASLDTLIHEFGDQKKIISNFANIPIEDILGARTPQLQIEGDVTMNALTQSGLIYDNSWPTLSTKNLFPYTLDYASTQDCTVTIQCPVESHPGFWIIPITNIAGKDNVECNSLVTCEVTGTAEEIAAWLLEQVNRVRSGTKTPLNLRIDSYWFYFTENSYEGLLLFLDQLSTLPDVFLVSQSEVLEWIKNPVPLDQYVTKVIDRSAECHAINCELQNENGDFRYMKSCIGCPEAYPWLYNPYGEANPPTDTTPDPDTTTTETQTTDPTTTPPPTDTTTDPPTDPPTDAPTEN